MQSAASVVFKTNLKEYRLPSGGGIVSSTTSSSLSTTTTTTTSSTIVSTSSPTVTTTTTMRPPPPPPPPKIKDVKNERGNEEPSSSIPDLGMLIFLFQSTLLFIKYLII